MKILQLLPQKSLLETLYTVETEVVFPLSRMGFLHSASLHLQWKCPYLFLTRDGSVDVSVRSSPIGDNFSLIASTEEMVLLYNDIRLIPNFSVC